MKIVMKEARAERVSVVVEQGTKIHASNPAKSASGYLYNMPEIAGIGAGICLVSDNKYMKLTKYSFEGLAPLHDSKPLAIRAYVDDAGLTQWVDCDWVDGQLEYSTMTTVIHEVERDLSVGDTIEMKTISGHSISAEIAAISDFQIAIEFNGEFILFNSLIDGDDYSSDSCTSVCRKYTLYGILVSDK